MTMEGTPKFTPLTGAGIPSAHRLSSQAGWNQTPEDWRRLIRLHPTSVGVWWDAGEIRACYSLIQYAKDIIWIGMILVDETYRGGGRGKITFETALQAAQESGCSRIGLDATDLGEPIYRKYGFEEIGPIVRWSGQLQQVDSRKPSRQTMNLEQLLAFDFRATGTDRSPLIRDLLAHDGKVVSIREEESSQGYAILRPGRTAWQIGPLVATDPQITDQLLHLAAATIPAGESVLCDVLQPASQPVLRAAGLEPRRHLKRMTLPAAPGCLCASSLQCAAGFELG